MYYSITAHNAQSMIAWASNENDVDRYVDWLNRDREINVYYHAPAKADEITHIEGCGLDGLISMDENNWDDFMGTDDE